MRELKIKGIYKHFKGDYYLVEDVAKYSETKEEMVVGAQFDKKISDEKTSKLIIFGENYFVSDAQLNQASSAPMISYKENKDLVLNKFEDRKKIEHFLDIMILFYKDVID